MDEEMSVVGDNPIVKLVDFQWEVSAKPLVAMSKEEGTSGYSYNLCNNELLPTWFGNKRKYSESSDAFNSNLSTCLSEPINIEEGEVKRTEGIDDGEYSPNTDASLEATDIKENQDSHLCQPSAGAKRHAGRPKGSKSKKMGLANISHKTNQILDQASSNCNTSTKICNAGLSTHNMVLPNGVDDSIPLARHYIKYQVLEKKYNQFISKKRIALGEELKLDVKTMKILKITVTVTSHPPAKHVTASQLENLPLKGMPYWQVMIEGKLKDDYDKVRQNMKFTEFFDTLCMLLDKRLYGQSQSVVEWNRNSSSKDSGCDVAEHDAFSVQRVTWCNTAAIILLNMRFNPPKYKLHDSLSSLFNASCPVTMDNVIHYLMIYVRSNSLISPSNRLLITCDDNLFTIFKCRKLYLNKLKEILQPFLLPLDPKVIKLPLNVEVPGQYTHVYEIPVELDHSVKAMKRKFIESTIPSEPNPDDLALDNQMTESMNKLQDVCIKRRALCALAADPQKFVNDWCYSQNRDLKIMLDASGSGNRESERRHELYNSTVVPWITEGVRRYLYRHQKPPPVVDVVQSPVADYPSSAPPDADSTPTSASPTAQYTPAATGSTPDGGRRRVGRPRKLTFTAAAGDCGQQPQHIAD